MATKETSTYTAWELIGFDGDTEVIDRNILGKDTDPNMGYKPQVASVRIKGGEALYDRVDFNDSTRGTKVRLGRLDVRSGGLRPVLRFVDPDTELEVITSAQETP